MPNQIVKFQSIKECSIIAILNLYQSNSVVRVQYVNKIPCEGALLIFETVTKSFPCVDTISV